MTSALNLMVLRRHRLGIVIGLWLSLAAGCMIGPDFKLPPVEVSQKWAESGEPSVISSPPRYRDWWDTFHDRVLTRLIQTAYGQNLTLRAAGVRVLEARAQLGIAIGEFYP
jgi:outer membrane protein TolC